MRVKMFITAMIRLMTYASAGQIRYGMNLIGADIKPEDLMQVLKEMVLEGILKEKKIGRHVYYYFAEESAESTEESTADQ